MMVIFKKAGEFLKEIFDTHGRIMACSWFVIAFGGGALVGAILQIFTNVNGLFLWSVILLTSGLFMLLGAYAIRKTEASSQSQVSKEVTKSISDPIPVVDKKHIDDFFKALDTTDIRDKENHIKSVLDRLPRDVREPFVIRWYAAFQRWGWFEYNWVLIYKSQLLTLEELIRKPLRKDEVKVFYDTAASKNKKSRLAYANYSFDGWYVFLKDNCGFIMEEQGLTKISVRGMEFMEFLLKTGRSKDTKDL